MYFKNKESLRGYYWLVDEIDERKALTIYQKKNVSEVVSKLLSLKDMSLEELDNFLDPKIKNSLKDPFHLLDMDKAVETIYEAIINHKKICIFGDYDVDGATATALMVKFFKALNINVYSYIPDRIDEGYGLNECSIETLAKQNIELIITVDCGTSSYDAIEIANAKNITVVVTDHHLGPSVLPHSKAVVNPNRFDETSDYKNLAGVGVAFMTCIALNKFLREKGYYENNGLQEPNLFSLLDLVALGTVCDVMPLTGINRAFVKQGLQVFRQRKNVGLNALVDLMELTEVNDTYHLGYVLGPRINASGRVGDASIGNRLLSTDDPEEAKILAKQLNEFNSERQNIEKDILENATAIIEEKKLYNSPVIFICGTGWHDGVIGIIASRIKDKYNRPVFAISIDGDMGKASCRSVDPSVDIGSVIIKAKESGLLISGGGHAMAGGFTFRLDRLEEIKEFVLKNIGAEVNSYLGKNEKIVNMVLSCDIVNLKLVNEIENLGPFGSGNTKPTVVLKDVIILNSKRFGKSNEHLRCVISSKSQKNTIVANAFRLDADNQISNVLSKKGTRCDLLGYLSLNRWMGLDSIQFIIEDAMVD